MNLILVEPAEVAEDGVVVLSGPRARHLVSVLGAAPGQVVRVGLLEGPLGLGTVAALEPSGVVRLHCVFESHVPARPQVDLLLALPRPKVLRRLWAQVAALGVGHIALTNAARVERHYFDTHVLAPQTYRPLLLEGLQQARDTRLPDVSIHKQFRVLIEDRLDAVCPGARRLVADPGSADAVAARLRASVALPSGSSTATGSGRARDSSPARVLLAVGPEGGWNAFELGLLEAHGFETVGMGPRTVRSDTACVALLALVHAALREA